MGFLGDFEKGKSFFKKGDYKAVEINDPTAQAFIELQYVIFFDAKSDFELVIKHCKNCIKHSENVDLPLLKALSLSCLGFAISQLVDCEQGKACAENFSTAKEYILRGMELCRELKLKPAYSEGALYLGELYLNAGQKSKAQKHLKAAEQAFMDMGMDHSPSNARQFMHHL